MTFSVFISSQIRGMAEYRAAARTAVEALHFEPILAEDFDAAAMTPRGACLDGVRRADMLVLIVGQQYGLTQSSGVSATEEEVNEARRLSRPVIVLKTKSQMDAEQTAFMRRLGTWPAGVFYKEFETSNDLIRELVRALQQHQQVPDLRVLSELVQGRLGLVTMGNRAAGTGTSPRLSVAWAPAAAEGWVDDDALFGTLSERVADLLVAGAHRLSDQRPSVAKERDRLFLSTSDAHHSRLALKALVWVDGSIAIGTPVPQVAGKPSDISGLFYVAPAQLQDLLGRMFAFVGGVTQLLDPDGVVRQGLVHVALESLGMAHLKAPPAGGPQSTPIRMARGADVFQAPDRPAECARVDLTYDSKLAARLVRHLERAAGEEHVEWQH